MFQNIDLSVIKIIRVFALIIFFKDVEIKRTQMNTKKTKLSIMIGTLCFPLITQGTGFVTLVDCNNVAPFKISKDNKDPIICYKSGNSDNDGNGGISFPYLPEDPPENNLKWSEYLHQEKCRNSGNFSTNEELYCLNLDYANGFPTGGIGEENVSDFGSFDFHGSIMHYSDFLKGIKTTGVLNLSDTELLEYNHTNDIHTINGWSLQLDGNLFGVMDGFNGLINYPDFIYLRGTSINKITGFKQVPSLESNYLYIENNFILDEIDTFESVKSIKDEYFYIQKNPSLKNLSLFNDLENIDNSFLYIKNNNSLNNITMATNKDILFSSNFVYVEENPNLEVFNGFNNVEDFTNGSNDSFIYVRGNNRLHTINGFDKVKNADWLYFEKNNLSTIRLPELLTTNTLELSFNNLSTLDGIFPKLNQVEFLNVGNNNITDLKALSTIQNINSLNVENLKITNLDGLQNSNLKALYAEDSKINDLSHIKNVSTLVDIDLSGTDIANDDMNNLPIQSNMDGLDLSNTSVTDFSVLSGISYIDRDLKLQNVTIDDTSFLNNITVDTYLSLDGSTIPDYSFLNSVDLSKTFYVTMEGINVLNPDTMPKAGSDFCNNNSYSSIRHDILPLNIANELAVSCGSADNGNQDWPTYLYGRKGFSYPYDYCYNIGGTTIPNWADLGDCNGVGLIHSNMPSTPIEASYLSKLNFSGNSLKNADFLSNLVESQYLSLNDSGLENIDGLSNFRKAFVLNLSNNNLTNIDALSNVIEADNFYLGNNNIVTLPVFSQLKTEDIQSFTIQNNKLTSVENIPYSTTAEYSLDNNEISDLSGFSSWVTLRSMTLNNNKFTNVDGFRNLEVIHDNLVLAENNLTDLSGFSNLRSVGSLIFDNDFYNNRENIIFPNDIDSSWCVSRSYKKIIISDDINHHSLSSTINTVKTDEMIALMAESCGHENIDPSDKLDWGTYLGTRIDSYGNQGCYDKSDIIENADLNNCSGMNISTLDKKFPEELFNVSNLKNFNFSNTGILDVNYLEGLTSIEEDFDISSTPIKNLSGISSLTSIGNSLSLDNTSIKDLSSFSNLETVGNIRLQYLNSLNSLKGLEKIKTVDYIYAHGNPNLIDLSGLKNLERIKGKFTLYQNENIFDFKSLANLRELGELELEEHNEAFLFPEAGTNWCSNKLYTKVTSGWGKSYSEKNAMTLATQELGKIACGHFPNENMTWPEYLDAAYCLSDPLDNGNVMYESSIYCDSSSFEVSTKSGDAPQVGNIGTNRLSYVDISNHENLENINFLSGLKRVKGEVIIDKNNNLSNLDGLSNLRRVDSYLDLSDNPLLTTLNGLESLEIMHNDIYLYNTPIVDFSSLSKIKILNGSLYADYVSDATYPNENSPFCVNAIYNKIADERIKSDAMASCGITPPKTIVYESSQLTNGETWEFLEITVPEGTIAISLETDSLVSDNDTSLYVNGTHNIPTNNYDYDKNCDNDSPTFYTEFCKIDITDGAGTYKLAVYGYSPFDQVNYIIKYYIVD